MRWRVREGMSSVSSRGLYSVLQSKTSVLVRRERLIATENDICRASWSREKESEDGGIGCQCVRGCRTDQQGGNCIICRPNSTRPFVIQTFQFISSLSLNTVIRAIPRFSFSARNVDILAIQLFPKSDRLAASFGVRHLLRPYTFLLPPSFSEEKFLKVKADVNSRNASSWKIIKGWELGEMPSEERKLQTFC